MVPRCQSEESQGFRKITFAVNGLVRTFQFLEVTDQLTTESLAFGNVFVFAQAVEDATLVKIKRAKLSSSALFSVDDQKVPFVFIGHAMEQIASREECVYLKDLPSAQVFFGVLAGAVDTTQICNDFLLARSDIEALVASSLADPMELATLNSKLKSMDMKSAFDIYLAASVEENATSEEVNVSCERIRKHAVNLTCPFLTPFLMQKEKSLCSNSLAKKRTVLAAVQEEVLQIIWPIVRSEKTLQPSTVITVLSRNLTPLEELFCDPSKWYLLKAVLFAAREDALSASLSALATRATSPRMASLDRKKKKGSLSSQLSTGNLFSFGRKAPAAAIPLDESAFVWESIETILLAHAMSHDFATYLVRDEILGTDDTDRLFREDSVASKWMSRKVQIYGHVFVDTLAAPFKQIIKAQHVISDETFLAESLLIVHALVDAITNIDFPLELRICLQSAKESCEKRNIKVFPILGRLVMLRWMCPMLINPSGCGLMTSSPTSAQLANLLCASKILIQLGEQTVFAADSSLACFNPWIESMRDRIQLSFLSDLISEESIRGKKKLFDFGLSRRIRDKKEFSFYLANVKTTLSALRDAGTVQCRDWTFLI